MGIIKVVFLESRTYSGVSLSGGHYYGTLTSGSRYPGSTKEVDLEFVMTQAQATRENEFERHTRPGNPYMYEAGMHSSRFESEEKLIEKATSEWKEHFPDGELLILGDSYVLEPQTILAGPDELKATVDALVRYGEELGWHDSEEWGGICDGWRELMKQNGYWRI